MKMEKHSWNHHSGNQCRQKLAVLAKNGGWKSDETDLYWQNLGIFLPKKILSNYKGKIDDFTVEKLGRHQYQG